MPPVPIGSTQLTPLGLGCIGTSHGDASWNGSIATIRRVIDLGITLSDTADAGEAQPRLLATPGPIGNLGALDLELTNEDLSELDGLAALVVTRQTFSRRASTR